MKLDGLTILRFTHATEGNGGVERYLEDINRALLLRNRLTIVQLYLPEAIQRQTVEKIGKGTIIKIPLDVKKCESKNSQERNRLFGFIFERAKRIIRDLIIYNPVSERLVRKLFVKRNYSILKREPINLREETIKILDSYDVALIVIHYAGGHGSAQVISEARSRTIPVVIFNHFTNNLFKRIGVREQVRDVVAAGGVTSKKLPRFLKNRYTTLLDGIDLEFFEKSKAKPLSYKLGRTALMLPSRVVPSKGHKDLIHTAYLLKKKGFDFTVIFAGREDSADYSIELKRTIAKYNMTDNFYFSGQLTQERLRDWYLASSLVVLPTYSEGLPRILLEAQAMEVPPVAYDVDGASEAVINGKTGYLVKRGSIHALLQRVEELLQDRAKRIEMGKEGRKFVESQFSFHYLAERHEMWYSSLIKCNAEHKE